MKLPKEFIETQEKALLKEKDRLQKAISGLDKYPDYGEMMDDQDMELRDYENNRSIEDQLSALLSKIEAALRSIKNGTYGQCKVCKNNIETGRLKNMPFADICVSCKTKNDRK